MPGITPHKILDIYDQSSRFWNISEAKLDANKSSKFIVEANGHVKAVTTCKLNFSFVDHCAKNGIVFSKEEIDDNLQRSHGGHPNM